MRLLESIKEHNLRGSQYFVITFLFILAVLWLWIFQLQLSHFRKAEDYLAKSNLKLAMREYDAAMHMFTPFSPLVEKSAQRLWQIGEAYEKMGRADWALIAYSSLRSSFFASQSIYAPGKGWIQRCEEKMAEINVKILAQTGTSDLSAAPDEKDLFVQFYQLGGAPNVPWSFLAGLGMFGWIASAVFLCLKAFGSDGKLKVKQTIYGSLSFLVCYAAWFVALLTA